MSRKVVDLSLTLKEGMQTFPSPNHTVVEVTQLGRHGIEDRETRKLVLGTHTGTHIDAPRHFIPEGQTVHEIDPHILVGPAIVVDLTFIKPGEEVSRQVLEDEIGTHSAERVVLRYGWSAFFGTRQYYTDYPYLSLKAAEFLLERNCLLLGMDTPTPDNPLHSQGERIDSPIHKMLLGAKVILVEYMTNLEAVSSKTFELIVGPLKIFEGDGAPARCFAVVKD